MDPIKDIIDNVIGRIATKSPDTEKKIERIWLNLLNKQELQHSSLMGVNNGKLLVHVDSPAWLYQLNTKKTKLLKRLQEEIPEIKYISFKIGKLL